jgi:peroxiredoxin family protein
MNEPLAISLFSGTDDRLGAAAVLVAGAAALGRPVHLFLQYWALDAFRADRIGADHGLSPEAGPAGRDAVRRMQRTGGVSWSETLRQAKEIGDVRIQACSLSMDLLGIGMPDLDPLVDDVEGVATFWSTAERGQVLFI